jgi:hypothetical protein
MIAGIVTPAGMLGGLQPHTVTVKPIAAVSLVVGDVVQFDFQGDSSTYTDITKITDFDNKKSPFNVVVKSETATDGGVFGVVTSPAAAGQRVDVVIAGMVQAKCNGTFVAGSTVGINGAGVIVPAATSGVGVGIALPLEANASGAATKWFLINGFKLGSQAL